MQSIIAISIYYSGKKIKISKSDGKLAVKLKNFL